MLGLSYTILVNITLMNVWNCVFDGCIKQILRNMNKSWMADIYSTNSKKLTAYQIALSSSNEEALQMIMKYEVKVKKKNFINKEALN